MHDFLLTVCFAQDTFSCIRCVRYEIQGGKHGKYREEEEAGQEGRKEEARQEEGQEEVVIARPQCGEPVRRQDE